MQDVLQVGRHPVIWWSLPHCVVCQPLDESGHVMYFTTTPTRQLQATGLAPVITRGLIRWTLKPLKMPILPDVLLCFLGVRLWMEKSWRKKKMKKKQKDEVYRVPPGANEAILMVSDWRDGAGLRREDCKNKQLLCLRSGFWWREIYWAETLLTSWRRKPREDKIKKKQWCDRLARCVAGKMKMNSSYWN